MSVTFFFFQKLKELQEAFEKLQSKLIQCEDIREYIPQLNKCFKQKFVEIVKKEQSNEQESNDEEEEDE